jgi:hypothetical protein
MPRTVTDAKRVDEVKAEIEYRLSEPIQAYGEEVTVIKLRKPTGGDLIRIGNPVLFYPHADPPKIEHDMIKMVTMIARLSVPPIPTSSMDQLSTGDLVGIAWTLSPFFIPAR